jgi:hypothetical protein
MTDEPDFHSRPCVWRDVVCGRSRVRTIRVSAFVRRIKEERGKRLPLMTNEQRKQARYDCASGASHRRVQPVREMVANGMQLLQ